MKTRFSIPPLFYHYLVLLLLIYCVVFLRIGSFHIRHWDESMFAVNTYEMLHNGSYFSLYFNGLPDLCNTKPPLTVWLQAASVSIFGFNEMAVRLPSALATALSILIIFAFLRRQSGISMAWIAALILLTSNGFIDFHTARTGDADALLTLFLLCGNLAFYLYCKTEHKKYILLFFIALTLAFATKLFAAALFLPGMLFYLLMQKKLRSFVFSFQFLAGILILSACTILLVWLREAESPGYLAEILRKDAGRLARVVEEHSGPASFYSDNLIHGRFSLWFVFLTGGIILTFFRRRYDRQHYPLLLLCISLLFSYLIILMLSVTKLEWYDMPLYPLMAILAAYPVLFVLQRVVHGTKSRAVVLRYLLILLLFILPLIEMIEKAQANHLPYGQRLAEASERFLFNKARTGADIHGTKVLYSGWNGSLLFYQYRFREMKQEIELITRAETLTTGDRVLLSNDSLKSRVGQLYSTEIIEKDENAEWIRITGIKSTQVE